MKLRNVHSNLIAPSNVHSAFVRYKRNQAKKKWIVFRKYCSQLFRRKLVIILFVNRKLFQSNKNSFLVWHPLPTAQNQEHTKRQMTTILMRQRKYMCKRVEKWKRTVATGKEWQKISIHPNMNVSMWFRVEIHVFGIKNKIQWIHHNFDAIGKRKWFIVHINLIHIPNFSIFISHREKHKYWYTEAGSIDAAVKISSIRIKRIYCFTHTNILEIRIHGRSGSLFSMESIALMYVNGMVICRCMRL